MGGSLPVLPPPPPFTPPPPQPPSSEKQARPSLLKQISTSKQVENQHLLHTQKVSSYSYNTKTRDQPKLYRPRRTNPIIWCTSVLCLIFSILLILFGIATLIIFVGVKPRRPGFDIPSASLSVVYVNYPTFLNGDLIFVANFTNPNHKMEVKFEYLDMELYFLDNLIAAQALQPFTQKRAEMRLVSVHMLTSLVYMPPNHAIELQKQVQNNRVVYHVKGTFRVRVNLGIVHFSYWLHSKCQLELTSPPTGVLIAHSCSTKR